MISSNNSLPSYFPISCPKIMDYGQGPSGRLKNYPRLIELSGILEYLVCIFNTSFMPIK